MFRKFNVARELHIAALTLALISSVLSTAAQAQTFNVIHNFTGGPDGGIPEAGVTIRGDALYGTARVGGIGYGTVYQITQAGSNWQTVPISQLSNGGRTPIARVVFGPDGHPYGTTNWGGATFLGIVFDLIAPLSICKTANCFWKENVIYNFGGSPDGANPGFADLVWDSQGNIYGTTENGGPNNLGTVYELVRSGNSYSEKVIYSFSGADGANPQDGVILDSNGDLSGTTYSGGANGDGTVFKLNYVVGVGWKQTVIYNFQNGLDGALPSAGLIMDSSGNLYGATTTGCIEGGGAVFELMPSGNTYTFKVLYSLSGNPQYGCGPWESLTIDSTGNLYGATYCGGFNNVGSVFKLTNTPNGWVFTSMHDFTGGADGGYPLSNVSLDTNGNLFGTATQGGSQDSGVVWMIKP